MPPSQADDRHASPTGGGGAWCSQAVQAGRVCAILRIAAPDRLHTPSMVWQTPEDNQPRMALVPSKAPNQVAFDFVDGTNIAPGDVHMRNVVFTFVDADHHEERWTSSDGGAPAVFTFTRKR